MKTDPLSPARILLVDDNHLGLVARKMILQEQGYGVDTALSGEEAWELFQKTRFDVVVTDYRMGVMDGLELIRLIRASESPARIVLLSGYVECLGMTEESTGADEVLLKSNKEVQELLRAVKKLAHNPPRRSAASARGRKIQKTGHAG
jgi:two-component system, chemotaxis family, sensor kinase CheA